MAGQSGNLAGPCTKSVSLYCTFDEWNVYLSGKNIPDADSWICDVSCVEWNKK